MQNTKNAPQTEQPKPQPQQKKVLTPEQMLALKGGNGIVIDDIAGF